MWHGTFQQGRRVPSRWHGRSGGWPQMSRGQWVPPVLPLKSSEQELEYDPTCQVFHTWTLPPQIWTLIVFAPLTVKVLARFTFQLFWRWPSLLFLLFGNHKSFLYFLLKLIYRQKALPIWKFPSDAWICVTTSFWWSEVIDIVRQNWVTLIHLHFGIWSIFFFRFDLWKIEDFVLIWGLYGLQNLYFLLVNSYSLLGLKVSVVLHKQKDFLALERL